MKQVVATIRGTAPYVQGRFHEAPKTNEKESNADYEKRTWADKMHVNSEGFVFVPGMALKNCLSEAAKYLSIKIVGKGKQTYTKHFESGVQVPDPLVMGIKAKDVIKQNEPLKLLVPSDGRRGGTTRVVKYWPKVDQWGGNATFYIFDDTITKEVFENHLKQAGMFIGLGTFRVRNNGPCGRFMVENYDWMDLSM